MPLRNTPSCQNTTLPMLTKYKHTHAQFPGLTIYLLFETNTSLSDFCRLSYNQKKKDILTPNIHTSGFRDGATSTAPISIKVRPPVYFCSLNSVAGTSLIKSQGTIQNTFFFFFFSMALCLTNLQGDGNTLGWRCRRAPWHLLAVPNNMTRALQEGNQVRYSAIWHG